MKALSAMDRTFATILLVFVFLAGLLVVNSESTFAQDTSAQDALKIKVESSNPLSGDPDAILNGNILFFKFCASCHGPLADGVSRFGAYAGNLTKFRRGYGEFIAIVSIGRAKKGMPSWGKYLDGLQISYLGAYLETLAIEGANWK